ncbi:AraC family transcriptional regulator [Pseudodesulfovibrio sp. zrk46]|uniref:AraC family transcriptional regulator n=1 Tax=Pseudodesulfovibrio sp. zrk46 TaxID=2725288 RepID=UPI001449A4A5|nr:AraC family transcriptional regulator [Pseudodesulfovibrio sp. zrk46]QJB56025.1 AraC family transcriptional regulator [Pseudodesulfovibrio sp. zrk46]
MRTPKETTKQDYARRMDLVLKHIHDHIDDSMALEELAEIACFSAYHFHRIFSGMVGESVKSYIRRIRLERAAVMLKHNDTSVTDIAFDAGFETHESFTRAFSSMFGISPLGYRKAHNVRLDQQQPTYWKEITMEAKVIEMEAVHVAYVRHTGPYEECHPAWETLCNWAGPKGLLANTPRFIGICHDEPEITPPDKIRYDACVQVNEELETESPVGTKTIPAGRYATTLHKGPYTKLAATYEQLCGQWLPQNGYELEAKPSFEVYLNDCTITPEEDLLTEVYIPVK